MAPTDDNRQKTTAAHSFESLDQLFRETGIEISPSQVEERASGHSVRVELETRYVGNHYNGAIPLFIVRAPETQVPFGPTDGPYGDNLVTCTLQKEGQSETLVKNIPLEELFPGGFPAQTQFTSQIALTPLGSEPPKGVYLMRFRGLSTRVNVSILTVGFTYRVILDGGNTAEHVCPPPEETSPGLPYLVRTKRADWDYQFEII